MNADILTKIGLTTNEVKVYLGLLELGPVPAGELIKKAEIHRTAAYDILERLIEKGLVTYIIVAKIKQFEAIDPILLLDFIDRQKEELDNYRSDVEKLIPELRLKRTVSKERQEATVFKGKRAIKTITEDILRTGKTLYVYGAEGKLKELFPVYYQLFHKKRMQKKIKIKIIYCEKIRKQERHKELQNVEMKYLPDAFETPANTWIFGDKIAIIVWSEQPIATLIRSKEVSKAYETNFNVLWSVAKE